MIDGLQPYPEYKDSGLPWIGEVPAHWGVRASKRMLSESGERARPDDQQLSATQAYGVILQSDYEERVGRKVVRIASHLDKRKHVEPDDFVISMRSFQGGLERAFARGAIRSSYVILKPGDDVHVPYFAHLFKSHPYIQALRATSEFIRDGQDLTFSNFSRVPLPVVPLEEQKAIADYLDANAVKVRRFIRNRRRLIEVLNEQKQAIINRAVTRGLDPNARLKPSGVAWLGNVPEHWEVMRVKEVTQVLRGKFTHRPRNDPALYDGPYPFIQTGEVARAEKAITGYRQTLNERGLSVSKLFPAGTLVMTIAANIGDVAVLEFEACFPDSVVGFVPGNVVERDYLYYIFRAMKAELLREAPVNTQGNLNVDRIGSRAIALAPIAEQQQIVRAIEAEANTIDAAAARARSEIELLGEYRTRLIADVVTGKLDVREAAAKLPDAEADTELADGADEPADEVEAALYDLDMEPDEAEA